MKTPSLIIQALILTAFASISFAETETSASKPTAPQSVVKTTGHKAKSDTVKPVDEAPVKASETSKPASESSVTEPKAAEESEAVKAQQATKEIEGTPKATKHSAEKAVEKAK